MRYRRTIVTGCIAAALLFATAAEGCGSSSSTAGPCTLHADPMTRRGNTMVATARQVCSKPAVAATIRVRITKEVNPKGSNPGYSSWRTVNVGRVSAGGEKKAEQTAPCAKGRYYTEASGSVRVGGKKYTSFVLGPATGVASAPC